MWVAISHKHDVLFIEKSCHADVHTKFLKYFFVIAACYETECVQKFTFHRLLIFNPYEYYLPFAMETFRFPASCDCYTATYHSIQEHYTFTKKGGNYKPKYKDD